MAWRTMPPGKRKTGAARKAAIASRVQNGTPIGLLGYLDGEPVAWCSIAPRSTYRKLVGDDSADEGVWSIVCFFTVRRLRGHGITRRIIAAAVEHARRHGARIVEAYPVDADSPSYRFMGFVKWGRREAGVTCCSVCCGREELPARNSALRRSKEALKLVAFATQWTTLHTQEVPIEGSP